MDYMRESVRWFLRIVIGGVLLMFVFNVFGPTDSTDTPLPEAPITITIEPDPVAPAATIPKAKAEDSKGWNCATQGNRICGPGSGHPAGCYSGGVLVIPWTNYSDPHSDPLWAQRQSPC